MHTAPNGKVYIGITCRQPNRRWGTNGKGYQEHPHFWNAIQKYGWDNIRHEILLTGLSIEEAHEKEKEFISLYRSNDARYGYNQTDGGDAGFTLSPESLERMSNGLKRKWLDPEYRQKIISANMGRRWRMSEESRAKMRKPKSEATKEKMRKPKSEETRRKMSEAKRRYFAEMTPEKKALFCKHVADAMSRIKRESV